MIMELGINRQRGIIVFTAGAKPVGSMKLECIMIEWKPEILPNNVRNAKTSGNTIDPDQNVKLNLHRNCVKEGWSFPLARGLFNTTMHPINEC